MLEHSILRQTLAWLREISLFLTLVKSPLMTIAESVVFFFGLWSIVWLLLARAH